MTSKHSKQQGHSPKKCKHNPETQKKSVNNNESAHIPLRCSKRTIIKPPQRLMGGNWQK